MFVYPKYLLIIFLGLFLNFHLSAQIVDVESGTQGILFPRVTNTTNVSAPAEGMVVYQTSGPKGLYQYDGTLWSIIGGSGGTAPEVFFTRAWINGASSDRYTWLASGFVGLEAPAQGHMPRAGTLTNLQIKPLGVIPAGATARMTVRVNGADTNLQLSFTNGDGSALKEDTDEVAVNKGDLVTIRIQEISGVDPSSTYYSMSVQLQ